MRNFFNITSDYEIDNLKEKIKENERHSFLLEKKSVALNKDVNEIDAKLEIFKNVMCPDPGAGQFEVTVSEVVTIPTIHISKFCLSCSR